MHQGYDYNDMNNESKNQLNDIKKYNLSKARFKMLGTTIQFFSIFLRKKYISLEQIDLKKSTISPLRIEKACSKPFESSFNLNNYDIQNIESNINSKLNTL